MTLPKNLILVRHGQSEGNIATKASEQGDNSFFTNDFLNRHSREFRLTDLGIKQAQSAASWLRDNITFPIDRYLVSDYIRAKETAAHLGLQSALWSVDVQLRERDMALMDNLPRDVRDKLFPLEQTQYKFSPFLSVPAGGGESFAALCLRIKADFLDSIARNNPNGSVIVVCHGHVMRAIQFKIEGLGHDDFLRLEKSEDTADKIRNCQIIWYSRHDPENRLVTNTRMLTVRSVCPWDKEGDLGWKYIERKKFTNQDLFDEVNRYTRHAS